MKLPVAIIAYNRPEYLRQLLLSLHSQAEDRKIYLFLDGANTVNDIFNVDACNNLFAADFPEGFFVRQPKNLGIAFHTNFVRQTMFHELGYDAAIFLEDDVVLNSYYLEMMDYLYGTVGVDEKVAAISGFGDHDKSKEDQENNKNAFAVMNHVWAYVLKKKPYDDAMNLFGDYLKLIPEIYRFRPHDKIHNWQKSIGAKKLVSSQDHSFLAALTAKGYLGASTYTNNLKYIGAYGEHQRPDLYHKEGYDKWYVYDKIEKDFVWNDEVFEKLLNMQKEKFLK